MLERRVRIGSASGLHARPASAFVKAVAAGAVPVTVGRPDGPQVDARSILAVLALGVRQGEEVLLRSAAAEAGPVLDRLVELLAGEG